MATHDYVLDNATGANFRSDLNNALAAIVSNNSSSSEPSTKYAYQWWADTNDGVLKIRNSSNDGWVTLLQLDGTLTLEDGSASAPALGFRDDLNTGIFSSAADTLDVTCGGTARGSFSSSGLTVTGNVTATTFVGNIDAVDGDFDGTLEADAITVAGVALSTVIAGTTVTTATNANHVSVSDNESTNENNLIPFIEDASATGNVGLESDGDFTYNPSTGTVTATKFVGETVLGDTSPQLAGTLESNGQDIAFADNDKAIFGTGVDFEIYHKSADNGNYIESQNSRNLFVEQDQIFILNQAGDEYMIHAVANGAVSLYYDNSKKIETTSAGIEVTGNAKFPDNGTLQLGAGNDLSIFHNGTDSQISSATNNLRIRTDAFKLLNYNNNEAMIYANADGAVELYFNNNKKFETLTDGVNITGTLKVNGSAFSGGGGKVLQFLQAVKTGAESFTVSGGTHDISGLTVNITPSSTSSKIYIMADVGGHVHNSQGGAFLLVRTISGGSATNINLSDSASNRRQSSFTGTLYTGDGGGSNDITLTANCKFLDSPNTTSEVNYKIMMQKNSTTDLYCINRTESDDDSSDETRTVSQITVMEIDA